MLKFAGAVTHFSPGLYANRPLQTCSIPNAFLAGDWVKGVPHGAKGLSQVRQIAVRALCCIITCIAGSEEQMGQFCRHCILE